MIVKHTPKILTQKFIYSLVIFLLTSTCFAQTEEEIKGKADNYFNTKNFAEATPLYLRLLALQPKSSEYSYKYGTCLLSSNNKKEALKYLQFSVKDPAISTDAIFFLAKALHLNFDFPNAISQYKIYCEKAGSKGLYYKDAQRNIAMCENGKSLLKTISDIHVKKKSEIKTADFFRLYDLAALQGSLINVVDVQSKNDKKNNHTPVIFLTPTMENIFFASYGDGDNLDIYVARRLPGGKFGTPQKINGAVNTNFDENYPYLHPNGRDLYFSSKGHNSMGGYDIFRAKFDEETNSFGDVINLDFAINSPDDDFLYIVDKEEKNAFFASNRSSAEGMTTVYNVGVERFPIQIAIIKGTFESRVNTTNSKIKIVVKDLQSGKQIGVFNNTTDKNYLITFPKGGKYEYIMTIDGSQNSITALVEIPYLKEIRPLKQHLIHEYINGEEVIRVINQFDEKFEDASSIIASVLQEKANLEINNLQSQESNDEDREIALLLSNMGSQSRSIQEFLAAMDLKVDELKAGLTEGDQYINIANGITINYLKEIQSLENQIRVLVKDSENSDSKRRKEMVLNNAKDLLEKRTDLLDKIKAIEQQAQRLQNNQPESTSSNTVQFVAVTNQLHKAFEEANKSEIIRILNDNRLMLTQSLVDENPESANNLLNQKIALTKEIQQLESTVLTNNTEIARLEEEIRLNTIYRNEVKDKFKQNYQDKIDEATYQLQLVTSTQQKIKNALESKQYLANELTKKVNLSNEIESYVGPKYSTSEVEKHKKELLDDKISTLDNYVKAQLKELNASEEVVPNLITKTFDNYNVKSEQIHNQKDLNPYEKQKNLLAVNQETKEEINRYIRELHASESITLDEKIKQRKEAEVRLLQLQEDEHLIIKQIEIAADKEISLLSTNSVLKEILPEYAMEEQQNINGENLSLVELQRIKLKEESLLTAISQKYEDWSKPNKTESEQKIAQQKIKLLEQIKASTNKKIENIDLKISEQEEKQAAQKNEILQIVSIPFSSTEKTISELKKIMSSGDITTSHLTEIAHTRDKLNTVKKQLNENQIYTNEQQKLLDQQLLKLEDYLLQLNNIEKALNVTLSEKQELLAHQETEKTKQLEAQKAAEQQFLFEKQKKAELAAQQETEKTKQLEAQKAVEQQRLVENQKQAELAAQQESEKTKQLEAQKAAEKQRLLEKQKQAELVAQQETEKTKQLEAQKVEKQQNLTEKVIELNEQLSEQKLSKKERIRIQGDLTQAQQELAKENTVQTKLDILKIEEEVSLLEKSNASLINQLIQSKTVYLDRKRSIDLQIKQALDPIQIDFLYTELKKLTEEYSNLLEGTATLAQLQYHKDARIYPTDLIQHQIHKWTIEFEELTQIYKEKSQQKETNKIELAAITEQKNIINQLIHSYAQQDKLSSQTPTLPQLNQLNVKLSFQEEREIASSNMYEQYAFIYNHLSKKIAQHSILSSSLTEKQNLLLSIAPRNLLFGQPEVEEILTEIQSLSLSLSELEKEITSISNQLKNVTPMEEVQMKKFQNLVARGINPIKLAVSTNSLVSVTANAIEYSNNSILKEHQIAIGVKYPKGLVFRVQVGAFSKPLPQSHFKEFTPITGEEIEGTTITRYLAGYFNNSTSATIARDQIRTIGYKDAFVVAYCAGKRISVAEANRLIQEGKCLPQKDEDLSFEAMMAINESLGKVDTTNTKVQVHEYTYNNAPGAVSAKAIEELQENLLFYTVQVGVYNRPASKDVFSALPTLYTFRLENGQIRYTAGMFGDFASAKSYEATVRSTGFKDAFVTVYFNGKRITLDQASTLIQSGKVVLPTTEIKVNHSSITPTKVTIIEQPIFQEQNLTENTKNYVYRQLISTKQYERYPREELTRYNTKGRFYYDPNDLKIKSDLFREDNLLPRISSFQDEMDTLVYTSKQTDSLNNEKIVLIFQGTTLPGDLADWLIKYPYRKSLIKTEQGIEIHIFAVRFEDLEVVESIGNHFQLRIEKTAKNDE